ncbi:four helix bundle protein [Dokdonella sp.]|uniref:four helix bundle protein n=1 Tax=Dokdonella sp. TaxID=2291710 RepID=UPI00261E5564|nr:four helix bundle protein [Dokdonella sp.]
MIRDPEKRPHERLDVWQDAMSLVESVYRLTAKFPDSERFGLVSQMRRAAVSVPSNIAEGAARRSTSEYLRSLSIARGSLAELDPQIQIASRLELSTSSAGIEDLLHRTFARLNALLLAIEKRSIEARSSESPTPNPESRPLHAR